MGDGVSRDCECASCQQRRKDFLAAVERGKATTPPVETSEQMIDRLAKDIENLGGSADYARRDLRRLVTQVLLEAGC